ncbi:MAG: hypothetical protein IPP46_06830 [Bacteroidetes bacterium]|nr:hypothetical protein [Bacteroidota bacterium]
MLDYMDEHLKSFTRNTGIFNEAGLQNQIEQIRKGNKAYTNQLWTIYFMMAWFKNGCRPDENRCSDNEHSYSLQDSALQFIKRRDENSGNGTTCYFFKPGLQRRKFEINPNDFKFSYTLLDGGKYSVGEDAEKTYFFYRGLWKQLRTIKPWRIISSGFSPATIICAFHKFIYGTPFLI